MEKEMAASDAAHKLKEIPEFKIKYNDVYSLRNLYMMLRQTLMEEGWSGTDGESDGSDFETYYSENLFQKGGHRGGKEMWILWRMSQSPGRRPNPYMKFHLEIDLHLVYIENIEVVHQGKKMTAQKGEIEIFFRPWIEGDVRKQWRNHWLLKNLQHIYEERIMLVEIEKKEKDLWREVYRIQSKIKQYLELRLYSQTPEPFFTRRFGFDGQQ